MLKNCDMTKLGSSGNAFTWKGKCNSEWIYCKLDRCFGTPAWFSMFPNAHQWFMELLGSDHHPVLVKLSSDQEPFRGQFRFDKKWAEDPSFLSLVDHAWNGNSVNGSFSIVKRISECRRQISEWKRLNRKNSNVRIHQLQRDLERKDSAQNLSVVKMNQIKQELIFAYREEEQYWHQKSREKWLIESDRNSKFFHALVKCSRVSNSLNFLLDENGTAQFLDHLKGNVAVKFFTYLFKSLNNQTSKEPLSFLLVTNDLSLLPTFSGSVSLPP